MLNPNPYTRYWRGRLYKYRAGSYRWRRAWNYYRAYNYRVMRWGSWYIRFQVPILTRPFCWDSVLGLVRR